MKALTRVMDALDVETFLVCGSESEARALGLALMQEMGFRAADVVFVDFWGSGARIRLRSYVNRPGDKYSWLEGQAR